MAFEHFKCDESQLRGAKYKVHIEFGMKFKQGKSGKKNVKYVIFYIDYMLKWYYFIFGFIFYLHLRACLIDFRKRRRERGLRERNTDVRDKCQLVASCTHPNWGLNPQPRHVP